MRPMHANPKLLLIYTNSHSGQGVDLRSVCFLKLLNIKLI
ncbi:Uncharacterized protein ChrSV_4262 [Chromobacterium vaccinii]|nr:Uncharacterized protein ChrSW_4262 [Chromobacterium vaccinii]QND91719.1 Uncharacterized protein ChrSV_4262 [Chromobacterium vaccinii]